ncbi:MAG TPA: tRNA uridine(34) 5-carboxymethylaminomethyl modification radical SAM/GNAT enzyme Elp3 [Candidatus Dojkabacteria bacterium]|nr:tRNA uridine(34) 5-carboxymethylaminomethyl modification radical SAM/GNAT enzyme Elp3 [Candidatus Dojkabacteria bacterium]HQF36978.1 tRNA uridine(34) 5-carboxymethylaminomethyl modification radical SAM/GNAT enzyme Elp3 [Candidatus Dojkabacteria bacterium]
MNTKNSKILNLNIVIQHQDSLQENFTHNPKPLTHNHMKKPIRSSSGVVVVTTFTKPYPCPGKCIFCPSISNVPKSYIPSEPACARANTLKYNPYTQISKRIEVLKNNGHNTDKIEIIISGGTFSYYPRRYILFFFARTFEALNNINPNPRLYQKSTNDLLEYLEKLQKQNENSEHKSVGISVETRPDYITTDFAIFLRQLGVTKVQIGVQSMFNDILDINGRAHTVKQSIESVKLLRQFGFKIQIHYMLNLFQSTPSKDIEGFKDLINEIAPDELKIYPTSIITNTKLCNLYSQKKYSPYTTTQLIETISQIKQIVPQYCRISRVFRDIPSTEIVAGNDKTNLREMIWKYMSSQNLKCNCIRCREIRKNQITNKIEYSIIKYKVQNSNEYFIQATTETINRKNCILGFLRLSIIDRRKPIEDSSKNSILELPEFLKNRAMIREIHVYGNSEKIGHIGTVQHTGIGKQLIKMAIEITKSNNFSKIFVISAVGTREYYRKLGFRRDKMGYLAKLV